VRYRKDTREMRLTYANDIAWKALLAGGKTYPDGAVFAKIGVMTQEDPSFTSSAVPMGAKRYQLMVMDHRKHAATDGWGYALFDGKGVTFEQNPEEQTSGCHACHQLVTDRGYVFSQPMRLEISMPAAMSIPESQIPATRVTFSTKKVVDLPPKLKKVIPEVFKEVRLMEGDLAKRMFQGTIDEIRPTLTKEALASHLPAILVNDAGTRFSLAVAREKASSCTLDSGAKGIEILAIYTIKPDATENYPIERLKYCEPPV